jgi:formate C-acetyltransferase
VLDALADPSTSRITAHAPGTSTATNETDRRLQTDAPLKRAIMPYGGWRMVEAGARSLRLRSRPAGHEIFTKYRKTHNDGVFDAYTPEMRRPPKAPVVTGLPDAYGRGRIIGDYRRVALYGVDRLIEAKRAERLELDARMPRPTRHPRPRRALRADPRARRAQADGRQLRLRHLRPGRTRREAVQWLYFAYLAAVKEQNGAAMSLGRASTFLDVYIERDLAEGG